MKPVQYFSKQYLRECKKLTSDQIADRLEEFRLLSASQDASKLISVRVPKRLLNAFRDKAREEGLPYQTKLKQLMESYLAAL
jgi:predicted DNA binding CopG/RHH family protein